MPNEPVSKVGRDAVDVVAEAIEDKIDSPVFWIACHVVSRLERAGMLVPGTGLVPEQSDGEADGT